MGDDLTTNSQVREELENLDLFDIDAEASESSIEGEEAEENASETGELGESKQVHRLVQPFLESGEILIDQLKEQGDDDLNPTGELEFVSLLADRLEESLSQIVGRGEVSVDYEKGDPSLRESIEEIRLLMDQLSSELDHLIN